MRERSNRIIFLEITGFPLGRLYPLFPPGSKFLAAGDLQRRGMIVALLREIYERRGRRHKGSPNLLRGARASQFVAFGPRALKPRGISINRSYSRYRGECASEAVVVLSVRRSRIGTRVKLLVAPSARLNRGGEE